ncbi:MAG TPA: TetR/AcrR family transcriptional regulator [Solirubrobacterales bacterium]
MARPAYSRLRPEERRRQLLERGAELFARHSYDELSMREIAREVGISKPLLYHYFPSKRAFFQATLAQAAERLRAQTEPDPDLPPLDQLRGSLEAFLELIEDNALAYRKLMQSLSSVPEVRELIEDVRTKTAARILEGLYSGDVPPKARAAVHGWLWFMDGACLDWIEHRDLARDELRDLLLGTLFGALTAADAVPADALG